MTMGTFMALKLLVIAVLLLGWAALELYLLRRDDRRKSPAKTDPDDTRE